MQVGEGRVRIGRRIAGDIGAGIEPGRATHFHLHLEREGDIAETPTGIVAAVDDHHGQRLDVALRPVRLIKRVKARVCENEERASRALCTC
jgi:hypothetical protein